VQHCAKCFSGRSRRPGRWAGALLCLAVLPSAWPVQAAEWYFIPTAKERIEYNNNRRLRVTDQQSAWGSIFNFNARIGVQTPRSQVELTPAYRSQRWKGEAGLDDDDNFIGFSARHNTERSLFSLSGKYQKDTTGTSELEETGRVQTSVSRRDFKFGPSWRYQLTQRLQLELGGNYSDTAYGEGTRFVDSTYKSYSVSGRYSLSPRTGLSVAVSRSNFERPSILTATDTEGIQLGFNHQFTQRWGMSLSAGPRKTETSTPLLGKVSGKSNLVNAGVYGNYENTSLSFTFSRSDYPTSNGELEERESLGVTVGHQFTDTLEANFSGRKDSVAESREMMNSSLSLRWKLARAWSVEGAMAFRSVDQAGETGEAKSSAVMLTIAYTGLKRSLSR